jgi:hypothetical protein
MLKHTALPNSFLYHTTRTFFPSLNHQSPPIIGYLHSPALPDCECLHRLLACCLIDTHLCNAPWGWHKDFGTWTYSSAFSTNVVCGRPLIYLASSLPIFKLWSSKADLRASWREMGPLHTSMYQCHKSES